MKKFLLFTALFLVACTQAAGSGVALQSPDGTRIEIAVEFARTPEEQERGLMFRTELASGSGMLFVFGVDMPLSFWMKHTLIPLDVLYFDSEGAFVSVSTMQPCVTSECPSYPSAAPAMYALEVPAGWAAEQGVGVGWTLELPVE